MTLKLSFALGLMLLLPFLAHAEDSADHKAKARQDVDVQAFDKLVQEKKYVILDVRTPQEFKRGHIPGAVNIDVQSPDFDKKMKEMDKDKTYLVHCASGVRSVRACDKMEKMDFAHLYNLKGGFKAWEKAKKPVEK